MATCESCLYWNYLQNTPTSATIGGHTLAVAQCRCRDEGSPYAEVSGPYEAAVFTHAESFCRAFAANPEAL